MSEQRDEHVSPKKAYSVDEIRTSHTRAYASWSKDDDQALSDAYATHCSDGRKRFSTFLKECSAQSGRTIGAIESRIKKLGLRDGSHSSVRAHSSASHDSSQTLSTPSIEMNDEFVRALELMERTHDHLFITGRAGTGKSTLLQYFRDTTKKNIVVLAPTGVAALNVGGQTIHRFFGFGIDVTPRNVKGARGKRLAAIKNVETIIIDEISMVGADILDCIDVSLRKNRGARNRPFGGVQMIFIGDLYQLPPVPRAVVDDGMTLFDSPYGALYFFDAQAFRFLPLTILELTTVYRQRDGRFLTLLNAVRDGCVSQDDLRTLNGRLRNDTHPIDGHFYIHLTSTNALAETINAQHLARLHTDDARYEGVLEGNFSQRSLPTTNDLDLKVGAQVMLLNNDIQNRWVNGSLGKVLSFEGKGEESSIRVALQNGRKVSVARHTWETIEYFFDKTSGALDSRVVGSFTQFPVRLAWAVTIHKAQGKTFDNVVIDVGPGTFAHGQLYVALSRCRTLEGITLKKPIKKEHIILDDRVVQFVREHVEKNKRS